VSTSALTGAMTVLLRIGVKLERERLAVAGITTVATLPVIRKGLKRGLNENERPRRAIC
jgi:hypothetical protein